MACNCDKNKTPDKVFAALKSAGINFRSASVAGIGRFVVPDPGKGVLEWRVISVDDISYEECMKRGANCESFQWVPKGLSTQVGEKTVTVNSIGDLVMLP